MVLINQAIIDTSSNENKSMKLLIFAGIYFPTRGGYVESIHGLSKNLIKKGHEVTIVTGNLGDQKEEEFIDDVRVVRLPCKSILSGTYPVILPTLKTFKSLRRLRKEKHDIVSTQTRFFTTSFLGAWFALWNRKPLVHTERGAYHSVVTSKVVDMISRTVDHTLGWAVVRLAKRNVGVSKASCDFLKHLGARNVHLIHNGVDLINVLSEMEKEKKKKQMGLDADDRVLLFVGRLIYAKGLQDVFPSLKSLIEVEPRLKMVVVGDGPYRTDLEDMVKKLKLEAHVRFLGMKPVEEVKECLQAADWFVNPSHSEGLPRSILEAAAAGLPIVATDVGGTAEIIQDQQSGLLIKKEEEERLKERLASLIKDQNLSRTLGREARKNIEKTFDWKKINQSYIDLFQQLI
jgi:glycosyltransferase involved in cell wall biosynthesis